MRNLVSLVLLLSAVAQAQTVYRSVDESGAVSFSDTPPEGEVVVEEVDLQVAPPQDPEAYSQHLDDMRETTDRMAEDRRAREKHRAELREIAAREASARQQVQQPSLIDQYSTSWSGTGSYYHRPGYPPWRPGISPRPPIHRPPMHIPPKPSHPLQGNSQLMRPILSR